MLLQPWKKSLSANILWMYLCCTNQIGNAWLSGRWKHLENKMSPLGTECVCVETSVRWSFYTDGQQQQVVSLVVSLPVLITSLWKLVFKGSIRTMCLWPALWVIVNTHSLFRSHCGLFEISLYREREGERESIYFIGTDCTFLLNHLVLLWGCIWPEPIPATIELRYTLDNGQLVARLIQTHSNH